MEIPLSNVCIIKIKKFYRYFNILEKPYNATSYFKSPQPNKYYKNKLMVLLLDIRS